MVIEGFIQGWRFIICIVCIKCNDITIQICCWRKVSIGAILGHKINISSGKMITLYFQMWSIRVVPGFIISECFTVYVKTYINAVSTLCILNYQPNILYLAIETIGECSETFQYFQLGCFIDSDLFIWYVCGIYGPSLTLKLIEEFPHWFVNIIWVCANHNPHFTIYELPV